MKKKMILTLALATLATSALLAGGYKPTIALTATNTFQWVNTSDPQYIGVIDIKCSGVTTATVTVCNFPAITNTIYAATNTAMEYAPVFPIYRVDKGGTLTVTFSSALTTNTVILYTEYR